MTPRTPAEFSTILHQPQGWDIAKNGPCVGLPIIRDGELIYSWWGLTWRERLGILFGRPVRLCVVGHGHPPVMLEVKKLGR